MERKIKKVFLFIYEPTHFVELFRVAKLLNGAPGYEPIIVLSLYYDRLPKDLKAIGDEKIKVRAIPGKVALRNVPSGSEGPYSADHLAEPWTGNPSGKSKIFGVDPFKFPKIFKYILFRFHRLYQRLNGRIARNFRLYFAEIEIARHFLEKYRPDLLIFAEDNVAHGTEIWIHSGKHLGIPSIVIPFTIANALEMANAFFGVPLYSMKYPANWLAGSLFRKWRLKFKGQSMVRLPAGRLLAMELKKMTPDFPWMINSGASAAICTESPAMKDYYLKEGIPEQQLALTGALYDDVLASALRDRDVRRKALLEKLEFAVDSPVVLCSIPPRVFERQFAKSEYKSHEEMIQFWVKTLISLDRFNAIFCLHPAVPDSIVDLVQKSGGKVVRQDTASLIPLCDLYVACISATIRWAIAAGIPVVNFDQCRYYYEDYNQVPGCLTVYSKQDFMTTLQKLDSDSAYYGEIAAKQKTVMKYWGSLDGHSSTRLLDLVERLTKGKKR